MSEPVTADDPEDQGAAEPATDPRSGPREDDPRIVVSYLTAPETDDYVAIMQVLDTSMNDVTPHEVVLELHRDGTTLDQRVVETRLVQLQRWGAVSARTDNSRINKHRDLLAGNYRYTATQIGRMVQRFYIQRLVGTPAMREIPLPSLHRMVTGLEQLAATLGTPSAASDNTGHNTGHNTGRLRDASASPNVEHEQLARLVNEVFTSHDDLDQALIGAEDNLAELVDRFDLDDDNTAQLKSLLVEYATRVANELDRGSARALATLKKLEPSFDLLAETALTASEARDLIASGTLTASRGGRPDDWTGLVRWCDPSAGRAARFSLRLVRALPGMHANLRRLHTSAGTATTRARALAMARACADPDLGTQIWQAAVGDHSWRKMSGVSDEEDQARTPTWRDDRFGVTLPELLRSTGRTGSRGRAPAARDDTAAKARIAAQRAQRQRLHAEALTEVLASAPGDQLSEPAARVAFAAMTMAARGTMRPDVAGTGIPGRVAVRDGLACTLLYVPGQLDVTANAATGILRAPTWRVLLPGRVALFHEPRTRPQISAELANAAQPDTDAVATLHVLTEEAS